jgi:hypothetical protein
MNNIMNNKRPVSDDAEQRKVAKSEPEVAFLEVRAPEITFLGVKEVPEVEQVWPRSRMGACFFCRHPHRYLCKLQSFECTTPTCAVRQAGVCVECAPQVETGVPQCPLCRGPSRVLRPEDVAAAVAAAAEAASVAAAAELAAQP